MRLDREKMEEVLDEKKNDLEDAKAAGVSADYARFGNFAKMCK